MKQKHLLKSLLLLLAIMAGSSAWADTVTDELTQSWTGVTGTSYTEWSGKKSKSDAVYAGQSAGGNSSIQLRSNNNNSGVITTTSGGKVKKVTVTWNSNTASGRTLNVYGKNTAYSAATDLYDTSKQGTLLGTIVNGTSTELTVTGDYEYIGFRSASAAMYLDQVDITWEVGNSDNRTATTVDINATGITNTNVFTGTAAGTLAATVMAGNDAVQGATVTWSTEDTDVATVDATTGTVTLVAAGTAVITATYEGDNTYQPSTATYTLTVTNNDPNAPGSVNNPYTVAQARAAIDANSGVTGVYATGIVSEIVTAYDSQYGNITYNISADGSTTADQLQAYRGKGKNGADFTSADDIQVGDVVVVYGNLKKYTKDGVDTYEFNQGNELVSLQRVEKPATPTISPAEGTFYEAKNVTISCETEGAVIYYTIEARFGGEVYNPESVTNYKLYSEPISLGLQNYSLTYTIRAYAEKDGKKSNVAENTIIIDLQKYVVVTPLDINLGIEGGTGTLSVSFINYPDYLSDTAGFHYWKRTETGTLLLDDNVPSWFHIKYSEDYSTLTYTVDPNTTTEARAIEVDFWVKNTFSDRIHFTQEGIVPDYAVLPFEFDGGKADIENTAGLTQDGLGSDYSSSPKLRFDNTDDALVLKFNERPGTLTFDIKGNNFSSGTFTVQTSEDGVTYTDLATYTELGATQSEEFNDLGENVRYIKWIYTEKSSGNVALGNIKLEKPSTDPVITVAKTLVELTSSKADGTIDLTYSNLDIDDMDDFGVQFYDAEGNELSSNEEPAWILVEIAEQDPQIGEGYVVSYVIEANEGEARTTYFKVFAAGGNDFVYSDLVTVSQAAYVAPGNWVLTDLADLTENDVFVIVGNNGDTYALPNDAGTSAPSVKEVSVVENTLSGEIAANLQWNLTSEEGGYIFYPNGNVDSWLYCTNGNNGVRVGTGDAKHFTLSGGYLTTTETEEQRYIGIYNSQDWRCYTNTTGNISGQTFSFYKKVSAEVESITVSAAGYRTYCSENALDFSAVEGLTAYKATISSDNKVSFTEVEKVPAGEGVLLKGAAATYDIPVINAADALEGNAFIGVTEETTIDTAPANGIYVLMNPEGGQGVGFYKTTGSTFTLGANTAYLPAKAGGARSFIGFDFDNTTTAIEGIANVENRNGEVYNLQGQRVSKAQKGLYIVGGKKVLVK